MHARVRVYAHDLLLVFDFARVFGLCLRPVAFGSKFAPFLTESASENARANESDSMIGSVTASWNASWNVTESANPIVSATVTVNESVTENAIANAIANASANGVPGYGHVHDHAYRVARVRHDDCHVADAPSVQNLLLLPLHLHRP